MTSVELRYYLKLSKLLEISKEVAIKDTIKDLKSNYEVPSVDKRILINGRVEAERFLTKLLLNINAEVLWLYIFDSKDFGPIQVGMKKLLSILPKLMHLNEGVFVITTPGRKNRLLADIDNVESCFRVEYEISGVDFVNAIPVFG